MRRALAWRDWSDGLVEAQQRGTPALCLAEPHWTNSAQRLALVLGRDEELRKQVHARVVPILVDPLERPDVAGRLRRAALELSGSGGPPLWALLDPEAEPLLGYCTMFPEEAGDYPSLGSLLRAVAELYGEPTEDRASGAGAPGLAPADAPSETPSTRGDWDPLFGGLQEQPKHPRPTLLWALMEESEAGDAAAAGRVATTLDALARGGMHDQLGGGFHRCSRDRRWIVPHFEKPGPLNAALAAVYARAAHTLGSGYELEVAAGAARFARACLDHDVLAAASDTHFYTWYPQEIRDLLDPELVQALGLHFQLTKDASRHTLYRALEPDDMAERAYERPETMRERVRRGRELLALHRGQRTPPELVRATAPAWRAEMVLWLLRAAEHGLELPVEALVEHGRALWSGPRDPSDGHARGAQTYLEDQAAILAAALEAHRATGTEDALTAAHELADVILDRYCDPGSGTLSDVPRSRSDARPSQALVDEPLASAVGTVAVSLFELAERSGEARYAAAGRAVAEAYRGAAEALGPRSALLRGVIAGGPADAV